MGQRDRARHHRLWVFALLAAVSHATLFVVLRSRDSVPAPAPPLAGKFLKRAPLREQVLRRPLSLPTRPRALRRAPPTPAVYARATVPVSRQMASARILTTPMSYALPRRPFASGFGVRGGGSLRSHAAPVTVSSSDQVDLGLELMDVEAMDTGRYRALVVEDPGNPRGLKGFVRLAAVGIGSALEVAGEKWEKNLAVAGLDNFLQVTDWRHSTNVRALRELALELKAQTQLMATMDEDGRLDETDWMESAFVLVTAPGEFVPTRQEVTNLGRYLTRGGFAYVEVVGSTSHRDQILGRIGDLPSLRRLVEEALTQQGLHRGIDWDIEPLALDHPLFNCYYEIQMLPRSYWSLVGQFVVNVWAPYKINPERYTWNKQGPPTPFLEGIYVQGRLAGIYSQQNYRDLWSRRVERLFEAISVRDDFSFTIGNRTTGDDALRLGVNIVVYALTQEGSLARQLVAWN